VADDFCLSEWPDISNLLGHVSLRRLFYAWCLNLSSFIRCSAGLVDKLQQLTLRLPFLQSAPIRRRGIFEPLPLRVASEPSGKRVVLFRFVCIRKRLYPFRCSSSCAPSDSTRTHYLAA
jgi:hypothetical protein